VTEVVADHADVDAGLEQGNSAAVTQDMWRDATPTERRSSVSSAGDMLGDDISSAIAGQRSAAGVAEDRALGSGIQREIPQRDGRFRPKGADPILSALAVQSNLPGTHKLQVAQANSERLANPGTRVVEEQQESTIATTRSARPIG
jgi:hypothetical protein